MKSNYFLNKAFPHTDLHCHSVTSAPFSAFYRLHSDIKKPPRCFKDFNEFNLFLKMNISPLVNSIGRFRYIIRSAFHRLITEGVVYTEMSFDLTIPEHLSISLAEYLDVISKEKERVSNSLKICVEAGLNREIDPQKLLNLFKESLECNIFNAIDLYGDENSNQIENYIDIYKTASSHNLKLKAHIGEIGTANDIMKAVQILGLHSIQHGINAVHSKEVIKFLIDNNIPLNICPSSNIALGIVKDITKHPIKKLFNEGVTITVNSDDFSIFGKSVRDELYDLYKNNIFSSEEIEEIVNNGLKNMAGFYK